MNGSSATNQTKHLVPGLLDFTDSKSVKENQNCLQADIVMTHDFLSKTSSYISFGSCLFIFCKSKTFAQRATNETTPRARRR